MKLILSGSTPSQKNSKQIYMNSKTGRRFITSSDKVKNWQRTAALELAEQWQGLKVVDYPISITIVFYYDSHRRHDLDNGAASVMDALVHADVIEDDSVQFVDCLTLQYGGIDRLSPRAEVYIDE